MEEATFKGSHEEKGDRPLFLREEGQSLSSLTKGLKGTVPKKMGLQAVRKLLDSASSCSTDIID